MKVILSTDSIYSASRIKEKVIRSVKGEVDGIQIDTWSYVKSIDNYDIIYHNPSQFINDPSKNVVFRVELDGENVVFSCAYWSNHPQPDKSMYCLHVGRLTEMLLSYFSKEFVKYSVIEF